MTLENELGETERNQSACRLECLAAEESVGKSPDFGRPGTVQGAPVAPVAWE